MGDTLYLAAAVVPLLVPVAALGIVVLLAAESRRRRCVLLALWAGMLLVGALVPIGNTSGRSLSLRSPSDALDSYVLNATGERLLECSIDGAALTCPHRMWSAYGVGAFAIALLSLKKPVQLVSLLAILGVGGVLQAVLWHTGALLQFVLLTGQKAYLGAFVGLIAAIVLVVVGRTRRHDAPTGCWEA